MRDSRHIIRDFIVRKIMYKQDTSTLDFNDMLLEGGIVDSLGIIYLIDYLQEEFDINISTSQIVMQNFASVESIATLVESLQEKEQA